MNLLSRLFGRRPPERVELHPPIAVNRKATPHEVDSILRERDQLRQQLKHATAKVEFTPGKDFVCVLPFCAADEHRLRSLLKWIALLGQIQGKALILAPSSYKEPSNIDALAREAFADVVWHYTPMDLPKEGWPIGANWMFLRAAHVCRHNQWDFWFNEPDCIPLRAGWFEAIRDEYRACGKPYLGFIEPGTGDYPRHLTGNAAYHHSVFHHFRADKLGVAWDIAMADVLTPLAHPTRLFHQEFGPLDHPPVFHTVDDLRRIPKEAVVFHRNKDGSLIRVLREQRNQAGSRERGAGSKTEGTKA